MTSDELDKRALELEGMRKTLLKMYHSNIQTHAGYLIAIIIGSLTLFSRLDTFFGNSLFIGSGWAFLVLLWLILMAGIWAILRIVYWTSYANVALTISVDDMKIGFNNKNARLVSTGSGYDETKIPPNTAVLSFAIDEAHDYPVKPFPLGKRIALITARDKKLLWFGLLAVLILIHMVVVGLLLFLHL
jgi:hypothetical protein